MIEPPLNFHNALYPHISKHLVSWATSPGSFVVLNLLEAQGFDHREEALTKLKQHRKTIKTAAVEETADQKASKAPQEKDASEVITTKKRKRDATKVRAVGNSGAKLLLKVLG